MDSFDRIGLVLGLALLPATALAVPLDVKPGLWESTTSVETSGAPPIDVGRLGQLPPQMRARMEAALQKQQSQGPRQHTQVQRSCVTREDLARTPFQDAERGLAKEGESCKRTVLTATSKRWEEKLECTGNAAITSEVSVEALSPESVKGSMTTHAAGGAHSMSTRGTFTSRWVSATCEKK